jgi:hypothetical protein
MEEDLGVVSSMPCDENLGEWCVGCALERFGDVVAGSSLRTSEFLVFVGEVIFE